MRAEKFYENYYGATGWYMEDVYAAHLKMPKDADDVLRWLMKNEEGFLTKDELTAIRLYYIEDMTLKRVGEEFGIRGEEVRHKLLERAFIKLREPSLTNLVIEVGLDVYEEAEEQYDEAREAKVAYAVARLEELDKELRAIEEKTSRMKEVLDEWKGAKTIDSLGLSVRATNALHRKGYHYAVDVANLTPYQINHIPNFGRCSKEEVKAKLEYLGLEVMW